MNRLAGRWGSLVIAAFQREVMYCRCLPPNTTELKDEAVAAAHLVKQQINQGKQGHLLAQGIERRL